MTNCFKCNKRIPPVNELMCKCKCGNVYCLVHRLSVNHECTYKYMFDPSKLQPCISSKLEVKA